MNSRLRWALLVWSILPGRLGWAQDRPGGAYDEARSLKCDFPVVTSMEWDSEKLSMPETKQQKFGFHIDGIDRRAGTARLIGNAGASDLGVVTGARAMHFVELTAGGSMNVTTVFPGETAKGLRAVHSRHVALLGGPLPSQHYGFCRPWG